MLKRLEELKKKALAELDGIQHEEALKAWKVTYLGRSTELSDIMTAMRTLSDEERPLIGRRANEVKQAMQMAFDAREQDIHARTLAQELEENRLDVTLVQHPLPARQGQDPRAALLPFDGPHGEHGAAPDGQAEEKRYEEDLEPDRQAAEEQRRRPASHAGSSFLRRGGSSGTGDVSCRRPASPIRGASSSGWEVPSAPVAGELEARPGKG